MIYEYQNSFLQYHLHIIYHMSVDTIRFETVSIALDSVMAISSTPASALVSSSVQQLLKGCLHGNLK